MAIHTERHHSLQHVFVNRMQSNLMSKIRSLIIKDLFTIERKFKSAILMVTGDLWTGLLMFWERYELIEVHRVNMESFLLMESDDGPSPVLCVL